MSGPFEIDLAYIAALPKHEQLEVYSQVQRLAGGVKGNPLWGIIPHAKQIEYLSIDTQVGAFLGGNRCLAAGTLVRMADGSAKAIEDIEPGEDVVGVDRDGFPWPATVLRRYDNGVRTVRAHRFNCRGVVDEIRATDDHKILAPGFTEPGYLVPIGEMTRGDKALVVLEEEPFEYDRTSARLIEHHEVGDVETHDLLIDHPDHLFLLANGLVVSNSGKSFAGTLYDILQVVDEECVPPWLLPYKHWVGECHWRVATPTLKTTLKQVVLPLFELMFPKDQLWKGSWDKAYHNDDRILTLANGNTIDFLTYEMKVDAFSGAAKHGIRLDEEPQGYKGRKIYEECMARLLSTGGDFRMTFTPLYGLSWSYHELTVKGVPRNDDEVKTVTVDMDDNPHLDERTKRLYLSKISPAMRKARKAGEFIHFEGLIYPEWDDSVHVIPEHPLPRDERGKLRCEVYVGIDPGRDHPLAIVWAYAMDGRLVIFDSIKLRGEGTDAESIAHMIAERNHVWGCRPRWYVIDPSARNKAHATGRSMQDELRRHGISTRPGQNARMAGYSRVAQLLRDRVTVDGRKVPRDEIEAREAAGEVLLPRLQVTENNSDPENEEVPGLVEEFPLYRWKPRSVSANEGPTPQEPIKVKDDALDAARYLIMSNPTELIVPEDEDLPPENPNEYEAWARAKKLRDHVETLMQRKRGRGRRRDNPGVVT